jgi:hypothetical protein
MPATRTTTTRAVSAALALTLFVAGSAAAQVSAATAAQQAAAPAEQNVMINVVARDYAFDAPVAVNAGLITFHLKNEGVDVHHLVVIQLANGHSIKEFFDAMRDKGVAPAWTKTLGATPTIGKNGEAYVSVRLDAGRYILACLIPASDGRSHVAKGMYQLINVTDKLKVDPAAAAEAKAAAAKAAPKASATKAATTKKPVVKP